MKIKKQTLLKEPSNVGGYYVFIIEDNVNEVITEIFNDVSETKTTHIYFFKKQNLKEWILEEDFLEDHSDYIDVRDFDYQIDDKYSPHECTLRELVNKFINDVDYIVTYEADDYVI